MYVKCSVECITAVQLKKVDENKAKRRDGQSPDTSGCSDITAVDSRFQHKVSWFTSQDVKWFLQLWKKKRVEV